MHEIQNDSKQQRHTIRLIGVRDTAGTSDEGGVPVMLYAATEEDREGCGEDYDVTE